MKHSTILYCCLLISAGLHGAENPDMGVSDLNITNYTGYPSNPRLSHGSQTEVLKIIKMSYDSDTATQNDINVSIQPTDLKPTTVRIRYHSSPWLNYEDDFYDTRFLPKPTEWTGHGKTGHVVDDDINTNKSRRVEW